LQGGRRVSGTMNRQHALPANLPPRLICREAAAAYVSVSPNKFDDMVENRIMPTPKRLSDRRIAWDVRELDAAIDALPRQGESVIALATDAGWEDDRAT
jgi:predicted DNA-binding transcriptional regulator AlpA